MQASYSKLPSGLRTHRNPRFSLRAAGAGYVKTDMTGGEGYIDVDTSADGIMAMLESGRPLAGRFYGFDGAEIPW